MRTSLMLAGLMSLSLAACATDDSTPGDKLPGPTVQKFLCPHGCSGDVETSLSGGEWIPITQGTFIRERSVNENTNICNSLPENGQCAYACDPQGYAETLPKGTCAAARCVLPDGGEVVVGGCN